MNRLFALIVATLLGAAPFATMDAAIAGRQAQAQWDAVFQMAPIHSDASDDVADETPDPLADIAAWMQPLGIKTSSDQDTLRSPAHRVSRKCAARFLMMPRNGLISWAVPST